MHNFNFKHRSWLGNCAALIPLRIAHLFLGWFYDLLRFHGFIQFTMVLRQFKLNIVYQ